MNIILGNIASLFANLFDVIGATRKTKKKILFFQLFSYAFYTITNLLLKSYSTVIQNLFAIVRNVIAYFGVKSKYVEYAIVTGSFILGIYFNNLGFIGLLPVIANLEYSICLFKLKDVIKLKISLLICNSMFIILNLYISNYVGFTFTLITVISQIIDLIRIKK